MMDRIEFSGAWTITVASIESVVNQRWRVSGAASGNGVLDGTVGVSAVVDGPAWELRAEWSSKAPSSPLPPMPNPPVQLDPRRRLLWPRFPVLARERTIVSLPALTRWYPSVVKVIDSTYLPSEGLVFAVGADDLEPERRDGDFNDVVLRCVRRDGVPDGETLNFGWSPG